MNVPTVAIQIHARRESNADGIHVATSVPRISQGSHRHHTPLASSVVGSMLHDRRGAVPSARADAPLQTMRRFVSLICSPVMHLIERIVGPLGLRVDHASPWVDA